MMTHTNHAYTKPVINDIWVDDQGDYNLVFAINEHEKTCSVLSIKSGKIWQVEPFEEFGINNDSYQHFFNKRITSGSD